MFCVKCGSKISDKEEKCINCGAECRAADRCGGFFDLINQQLAKKQEASVSAVPMVDQAYYYKCRKEAEDEEMRKKALIVVSAICAILLIIVLVQAFKLSTILDSQLEVSQEVEDVKEMIEGNRDYNEDGMCDLCDTCLHGEDKWAGSKSLDDGTHRMICECGQELEETVEECDFGLWNDSKRTCLVCGYIETCSCDGTFTYVAKENDGNNHEKICDRCNKKSDEECTFPDNGGQCQHCTNVKQPASEENVGQGSGAETVATVDDTVY